MRIRFFCNYQSYATVATERSKQALKSFPLFLITTLAFTFVALGPMRSQEPRGSVQAVSDCKSCFDVISVKRTKPDDLNLNLQTGPSRFHAEAFPLNELLFYAYGIRKDYIFGLPPWASDARFDIEAKVSDPDLPTLAKLSFDQRRPMIADIFVKRFGLRTHREMRTLPVLELTVIKGGPKFKETAITDTSTAGSGGLNPGDMSVSSNEMSAVAVPMSALAAMLERQLGRAVIDKTGLIGKYDLSLTWSPDGMGGADAEDQGNANSAPGILTAIQLELGLKLVPGRGPVETLVVDHIDPPTSN